MEEGILDKAPIWSDLRTFCGVPWNGVVDLVTAGFPCQPVSVAGKRLAQEDHRWMWPDVARVIREAGPCLVFLENVPGLLVRGFGDVLGDLAEMGFAAEWGVFSAKSLGAPHQRDRVFVLAYSDSSGFSERESLGEDSFEGIAAPERGGMPLWPPGPGGEWPSIPQGFWPVIMADSDGWGRSVKRERRLCPDENAQPGDDPDGRNLQKDGRETQPAVRGVADGLASRVDRLRACGNGVVPVVAAAAFRTLANRLGLDMYGLRRDHE